MAESENEKKIAALRRAIMEGLESDDVEFSFEEVKRELDDEADMLESVERGWLEIQAGLGEEVTDGDTFFEEVRAEIRSKKTQGNNEA